MNAKLLLTLTILATTAGCVTAGEMSRNQSLTCSDVLKPSELLRLGSDCDSEKIRVRGVLRIGPEMHGLWDSYEDIEDANYRETCITVYNNSGFPMEDSMRTAEVTGLFHASRPDRLFILGACSDAILEVESYKME